MRLSTDCAEDRFGRNLASTTCSPRSPSRRGPPRQPRPSTAATSSCMTAPPSPAPDRPRRHAGRCRVPSRPVAGSEVGELSSFRSTRAVAGAGAAVVAAGTPTLHLLSVWEESGRRSRGGIGCAAGRRYLLRAPARRHCVLVRTRDGCMGSEQGVGELVDERVHAVVGRLALREPDRLVGRAVVAATPGGGAFQQRGPETPGRGSRTRRCLSQARLKPDRVSPTGRQGRCKADSSDIHERHVERAVPRRVQRCVRGVLCRTLPSMIRRERKRCGPPVGRHLRRVARDTQAGPRQNGAARLARLPGATSTEAGYLPETEVV